MSENKISLRNRHAAETKEEILKAAVKVFSKYGYSGSTTKKIAESAGISEGTIYNYFKNKHDLLLHIIKNYFNQIRKTLQEIPTKGQLDNGQDFVNIFTTQLQQFEKLPLFTLIAHECRLDPEIMSEISEESITPLSEHVENLIQRLITAKIVRTIDPKIFSLIMSALFIGFSVLIETENIDYQKFTAEEVGKKVVDILLNGIRSR
jgi:AcrR family transcriptional regulator